MRRWAVAALTAVLSAMGLTAFGVETATLRQSFGIGQGPTFKTNVTPGAIYSNLTNFADGILLGDAGPAGNDVSTYTLFDDLSTSPAGFGQRISDLTFSIINLNESDYTVTANLVFYDQTGAASTVPGIGNPGQFLGGVQFAPVNVGSGTAGLYGSALSSAINIFIPSSGKLWVGVAFSSTNGATANTADVLSNFGVAIFDPPDIGSSADLEFDSNAYGAVTGPNPEGLNFDSSDYGGLGGDGTTHDNQAYELVAAVPEPQTFAVIGVGVIGIASRRRRQSRSSPGPLR